MGDTGLELPHNSRGICDCPDSSDAASGASSDDPDPNTRRDLDLIARVWPRLSDLAKGMVMEVIADGLTEQEAE